MNSLRLQITLLYIALALLNITFFSVMVLESQMALLLDVFRYQAKELESLSPQGGRPLALTRNEDQALRRLTDDLLSRNIENFLVFDGSGEIWHRVTGNPERADWLRNMPRIPPRLLQATLNFSRDASLLRKNSEARLNEDDYSVDLLTMLDTETEEPLFLFTVVSVDEIRAGRNKIYVQVALILFFGILFHIAFGLFLYYRIFLRVGKLKEASDRLAEGDLSARALWKEDGGDEMDRMGSSFNNMAGRIQEQVTTITNLNAEMQRELEIGKEVQQLFLPREDVFEDALRIYYRPLREVSGDIYSLRTFGKQRALFFADASGHGVSAALITAMVVTLLEDAVRETRDPGRILSRLNGSLTERFQANFFATGVFFLFDASFRRLTHANAGHLPPLHQDGSTGSVTRLAKGGPPMGMLDRFDYPVRRTKLKRGDRLFLYSDGLIEHPNAAGEEFGLERVEDLLRQNADLPTDALFDLLTSTLEEWVHEYRDDVSIFLLEVP